MSSVPLQCLATALEDLNSACQVQRLVERWPARPRHMLEYCMGMAVGEFSEDMPLNSIQIRPSMREIFLVGWALVPSLDVLNSMLQFQTYNRTCAISSRRHFTEVFSAHEYEYTLIPTELTCDLFVTFPGEQVKRFSPPYLGLPSFRSSANPFFVACNADCKVVISDHPSCFQAWRSVFNSLSLGWLCVPPTQFVKLPPLVHSEHDSDSAYGNSLTYDSCNETSKAADPPVDYGPRLKKWRKRVREPSPQDRDLEIMDEGKKKRKFIRIAQSSPLWQVESSRGRQWKKEIDWSNRIS